jgi:hypothetical protein
VSLAGWDAYVADLGSANGTFVQPPGEERAGQLRAHQRIALHPGAHVTIGRRWFRFESLRPQA